MSSRRVSKKCLASYILLFVIIIAAAGLILLHGAVKQHLAELCRYKCGEIVNNILTETARDASTGRSDYYTVRRDGTGRIISVEANTRAMNELQNALRNSVNSRLSASEYDIVSLTLGDLTDIAFFSGRGPDISIRYQQSGTADTKLLTSFESAGINQTRLRVSVLVSVEFTAFLPTGEENLTISQEYIAADTVIIGEIPEHFFQDAELAG